MLVPLLVFIPPDFNPIEQGFSKLKAHLRRIGARTFSDLFEALGEMCNMLSTDECRTFLKAFGYIAD
jgi:transposase